MMRANAFAGPSRVRVEVLPRALLVCGSAICLLMCAVMPTRASAVEWAIPRAIPGYTSHTQPPRLLADRHGRVHAFASQWTEDADRERVIIYSQWTLATGWTPPRPIVHPPFRRQAVVHGVLLDRKDLLHLIFVGGDDVDAKIYYTRARLRRASHRSAWSTPIVIAADAVTPRTAELAGDGRGHLVVVFSSKSPQVGLYAVSSTDGGDTWTRRTPLFFTPVSDPDLRPAWLEVLWDGVERTHAVWAVVNKKGHYVSAHYARADGPAGHWTAPVVLDETRGLDAGLGISLPAITMHTGTLMVMYNNGIPPSGVPPAHWFRYSTDGGGSWTPPERAFPRHIGRNGRIAFASDSAGTLHTLFGQRIPGGVQPTHGMWHSTWRGGQWSEPSAVASGPRSATFDPFEARTVVSQGNVLLATWMNDPGLRVRGTWYSYATLDAPALPPEPLVTPRWVSVSRALALLLPGAAVIVAVVVAWRRRGGGADPAPRVCP